MARAASPKRAAGKSEAAPKPPQTPNRASNRERPPEPKRRQADKAELLDYYRQMLLIRRFEERAGQLYGLGLIGGFCHLYIGQERSRRPASALTIGKDSVITGFATMAHARYGIDPK